MADNKKTVEELMEDLKAERAKTARLKKSLETAQASGVVSPVVDGTFTATGKDANGKTVTAKFRFLDGRVRTPLRNGQQVPSAALMQLAGGTDHAKIDCDLPWFLELTKEDAQAELQRLVDINASTIEAA